MKKSIFVFLLAFLPFSMPAQNAFERPWSVGPLSWSEFRPANDNDEGQSHSQIVWREKKARLKNAGVRYQFTDVHASFNPDFSYVREGFRNPAQLRLNQGIFNINEKYALEFRDSLAICTSGKDSLRSRIYRRCQDETESWKNQWELNPEAPLPGVPADNGIALPAFKSDWESYFGVGYVGKLVIRNGYYPWVNAIGLTFGMRFNRHYIELEGDMTAFGSRRYSALTDRFMSDYLGFLLKYGYNVVSTDNFRASVFLGGGGGILRFTNPKRNIHFNSGRSSDKSQFGDLSPQAIEGLALEYDVAKFVSLNDTRYDFSRVSLFMRVYADQMFLVYSSNRNAVRLTTSVSAGVKISRSFNKRKP